jgi:hypothetical protein
VDLYRSCVRDRVDGYYVEYAKRFQIVHSPRSRASLIHDHIIDLVRRRFGEVTGAQLVTVRGRFVLTFSRQGSAFHGSFKKVDRTHRPRFIRTRQAVRFVGQVPLFEVEGTATNLILGYRLNKLATGLAGTYIICPDGDAVAWVWQIDGAEQIDLFPVGQPEAPAAWGTGPQQPARPRPSRVRLKDAAARPDAASGDLPRPE